MKRFDFKLEPVLKYRKMVFEQVREEFYNARRLLLQAIEELENIQKQEKDHRDTLKKKQRGFIDISNVVVHIRYLSYLNRLKKVKLEDIRNKERELDKVKEALIKVSKDKKILEKLKEKRLRDFLSEELMMEQKEYDETAINKFVRTTAEHER